MSKVIIAGKDCEACEYCEMLDETKIVKVFCRLKDRQYYYGQCIPCVKDEVANDKIINTTK